MNLKLRTETGYTEAVLDETPSFDSFYRWADYITEKLNVSFTRKLDDFEALYWDFIYKGTCLTLSYNIFNGISIFPVKEDKAAPKENEVVAELAKILAGTER